jgi:hypothetical protein
VAHTVVRLGMPPGMPGFQVVRRSGGMISVPPVTCAAGALARSAIATSVRPVAPTLRQAAGRSPRPIRTTGMTAAVYRPTVSIDPQKHAFRQ